MRRAKILTLFALILTLVATPVIQAASKATEKEPAAAAASASTLPRAGGRYVDVPSGEVRDALDALAATGLPTAFPGDDFRPSKAVTLGEFARAAAAVFDLSLGRASDPDLAAIEALTSHDAIPDSGKLKEDARLPLSLGNMILAIENLAGMQELRNAFEAEHPDPALAALQLADAAGLLPSRIDSPVDPAGVATRGDAVVVLDRATRLTTVSGKLTRGTGGASPSVSIMTQSGPVSARVGDATVVLKNGQPSSVDALSDGDQVIAAVDGTGRMRVAVARGGLSFGGFSVDKAEMLQKGRALLQEAARRLTPEQWQAVLRGDWETLGSSLTPQLYDQMMALGVAPWEAEALMNRDWTSLRQLAMDRLSQEGGSRLNVSPELLRSALDQDWQTTRQLAEQELIERAINAILGPAKPGASTPGSSPGTQTQPSPSPDSSPPPEPDDPAAPATQG